MSNRDEHAICPNCGVFILMKYFYEAETGTLYRGECKLCHLIMDIIWPKEKEGK